MDFRMMKRDLPYTKTRRPIPQPKIQDSTIPTLLIYTLLFIDNLLKAENGLRELSAGRFFSCYRDSFFPGQISA